ncbi:MAG: hypothetical protein D3910_21750 [Candidatus Electrothrix sp. ATG2]|nr:hypothetical protein [Candidatus Electrothrix sp. ATG2]
MCQRAECGLKPNHIIFFCNLFKYKGEPIVIDAIPSFNCESNEWCQSKEGKEVIGMLRALRGLGLIQPREGGKWENKKHIEITKFGTEFKGYIKG